MSLGQADSDEQLLGVRDRLFQMELCPMVLSIFRTNGPASLFLTVNRVLCKPRSIGLFVVRFGRVERQGLWMDEVLGLRRLECNLRKDEITLFRSSWSLCRQRFIR